MGEVTVDDAAWMNVLLKNKARGSIEVSRFAGGKSVPVYKIYTTEDHFRAQRDRRIQGSGSS